jgi:hypothetical protein
MDEREWRLRRRFKGAPWRVDLARNPCRENEHLATVVPKSTRQQAERERDELREELRELREGMRALGFIPGRNPDGVDDTVAATLLAAGDMKAALDEARALIRRAGPFANAVRGIAPNKAPSLSWIADAAHLFSGSSGENG